MQRDIDHVIAHQFADSRGAVNVRNDLQQKVGLCEADEDGAASSARCLKPMVAFGTWILP